MSQPIIQPPILSSNVTIKISKPQKIALVNHLVENGARDWTKEMMKAQVLMLRSQPIFSTLNEKQIKRQIKMYQDIVNLGYEVGIKMYNAMTKMGAGFNLNQIPEIPFAKQSILCILSTMYQWFMVTAPKCILPTEFKLFLERCDDGNSFQLQDEDNSFRLEMHMSPEDICHIVSFENFMNLGWLKFWQEAWAELTKIEKSKSFNSQAGYIISNIDASQNSRRYASTKIGHPLFESFYTHTYAADALKLKKQDQLYTDNLFDMNDISNYVPGVVKQAIVGDEIKGRESVLCIIYAAFEQISYDKCKEYLLLYRFIDDEEIQASVPVNDIIDDDEFNDDENNDELPPEIDDEIVNKSSEIEAVTSVEHSTLQKMSYFIMGSSFRKTLGIISPTGSKDSPKVRQMKILAVEVLSNNLLLNIEQAKEMNLPTNKVEERGNDKGNKLFCVSDKIYNLVMFLETDILSKMLCNMKSLTAFRSRFFKYVKHSIKAHDSYDDMLELFQNTLRLCPSLTEEFISEWSVNLNKKFYDHYLRVAANDYISQVTHKLEDFVGLTGRTAFRLQVLTDIVNGEIKTDCM